jgi:hypothetical protein
VGIRSGEGDSGGCWKIPISPEAAAHNLLELALAAGGHDNIGIEMARLIAPPDIPPRHQQVNPALIWVLGVFLLSLVGLFVLALTLPPQAAYSSE